MPTMTTIVAVAMVAILVAAISFVVVQQRWEGIRRHVGRGKQSRPERRRQSRRGRAGTANPATAGRHLRHQAAHLRVTAGLRRTLDSDPEAVRHRAWPRGTCGRSAGHRRHGRVRISHRRLRAVATRIADGSRAHAAPLPAGSRDQWGRRPRQRLHRGSAAGHGALSRPVPGVARQHWRTPPSARRPHPRQPADIPGRLPKRLETR